MPNKFEINQRTYRKDYGEIVLYQRADKKVRYWQCRIKIRGTTGYAARKSCKTLDEFEARRYAETLYESLVDKFKATGSTKTKPFRAVVAEWLQVLPEQEKNPDTIKESENRLNAYPVRFWKDKSIDTIKDADIVAFIDWRKTVGKKVPAESTIRKDLVPLKQVFKYAYGKKYISAIPQFENFSASGDRRPGFTEQEWTIIVNNLDKWIDKAKAFKGKRYRTYLKYYILILGDTGIRPGTEHQSITWNCLQHEKIMGFEHPQLIIKIPKGKNGYRETVPPKIVNKYVEELKVYRIRELEKHDKSLNDDEPIFCHNDGKPIKTFKKNIKEYLEWLGLLYNDAGIRRVPYSLRHTYATRMINQGVNHWNLASNMGTSVEMLEKNYVHDNPHDRAKEMISVDTVTKKPSLF